MSRTLHRRAFTLLELLVVIAIISLLISILLPSLNRAREQSRAAVCLSNMREVSRAFFLYAADNSTIPGTYWQGAINLDWAGRVNAEYLAHPNQYRHPLETSVLRRYLSSIDKILECPTAHREANTFFDYTVIIRLAGARVDLPWVMTYRERPGFDDSALRFPLIPLLIEEDSKFYNRDYDDGSWANLDQITDRHNRYANIAYLDGSVSRFKSPKGVNPDIAEAQYDLTAREVRLLAGGRSYEVWGSNANEFGWVNHPR